MNKRQKSADFGQTGQDEFACVMVKDLIRRRNPQVFGFAEPRALTCGGNHVRLLRPPREPCWHCRYGGGKLPLSAVGPCQPGQILTEAALRFVFPGA